jgi:hypothetical protein
LKRRPKKNSTAICNVHSKGVIFLTQKLLPLINDWGADRQRVDGATSHCGAKWFRLRIDEGRVRGAVEARRNSAPKDCVIEVAPGDCGSRFSGGIVRDNPAMNKRADIAIFKSVMS